MGNWEKQGIVGVHLLWIKQMVGDTKDHWGIKQIMENMGIVQETKNGGRGHYCGKNEDCDRDNRLCKKRRIWERCGLWKKKVIVGENRIVEMLRVCEIRKVLKIKTEL